jgi:hypothetical protein
MKRNVLSIDIKAPTSIVFEFTRNPSNTAKWVPGILEETLNTSTTNVGSIYRQKWKDGKETAMVITGCVPNKQLDFHSVNGTYTCMYKYEEIPEGTRLTYSEENGVDREIDGPFTRSILEKLKQLIENR